MERLADGHAFGEGRVLVKVADADVFGPFYGALVRNKLVGNDTHKGRLSFAVRAHKADVLAFEQAERNVGKNGAVAKAVRQILYG